MSITALVPAQGPRKPEINADESGVRIFFPTDDNDYSYRDIGEYLCNIGAAYPGVMMDSVEGVEGGILFDSVYPGRVL